MQVAAAAPAELSKVVKSKAPARSKGAGRIEPSDRPSRREGCDPFAGRRDSRE
jgi:hypothetical protein